MRAQSCLGAFRHSPPIGGANLQVCGLSLSLKLFGPRDAAAVPLCQGFVRRSPVVLKARLLPGVHRPEISPHCKAKNCRYVCGVKISVIVPAFNEEKLLGASLAEIQSAASVFKTRGWDFELIVCDNNSTDRTAEVARGAGAIIVFEPINQIARARNAGAAAATGDWLIFVDADTHPGSGLFEDVAEQIVSGKCLAGGYTIRLDEKMLVPGAITGLWNFISRWRRLMAGSFIFVDATVFREVGGFSKELFAAEEIDLSRRIHRYAKGKDRRIVILHRHPIKTSARKMKLYSAREHLGFFLRAVFNQRRTLRSREEAFIWYDGRR